MSQSQFLREQESQSLGSLEPERETMVQTTIADKHDKLRDAVFEMGRCAHAVARRLQEIGVDDLHEYYQYLVREHFDLYENELPLLLEMLDEFSIMEWERGLPIAYLTGRQCGFERSYCAHAVKCGDETRSPYVEGSGWKFFAGCNDASFPESDDT